MSIRMFRRHSIPLLGALIFVLAACGSKEEDFIRSGKAYLEKNDRSAALVEFKNAVQANPDRAEARYYLGVALYRTGDPLSAAAELRKAKTLGMPDEIVLPDLATAIVASGEMPKSIEEVRSQAPASGPLAARLLAIQGDAYLIRNDVDKARRAYESALVADPTMALAKIGLARLSSRGKQLSESNRLVDEALAADAGSFDAWLFKGVLLSREGKYKEAVDALDRAASIQPWDMRPFAMAVTQKLALRDIAGAEKSLSQLRKSASGPITIHFAEAQVAYEKGNATQAREHIRRALGTRAEDPPMLLLAARIEQDLGNFLLAEKHLGKVLQMVPEEVAPRVLLSSTHMQMGQIDKAKSEVTELLRTNPNDANVLRLAGDVAMLEGDARRAVVNYDKVAQIDGGLSSTLVRSGRARLAAGEAAKGTADLLAALKADPSNLEAEQALITQLVFTKDLAGAKARAAALEARMPDRPEPLQFSGLVAVAERDRTTARAKFEKALAMAPGFLPAARGLGKLDIEDNQLDAAKKRYQQFIKADPRQPAATFLLAQVLEQSGAPYSEIVATLDAAIAANASTPQLRARKVEYLLRIGERKAALDAAQESQAVFPDDTEILALTARTQALNRDNSKAITSYSKLASIAPASPDALLGRANVYAAEKDWPRAFDSIKQAIAAFPDHVPAYVALVGVRLKAKQFDEALADARTLTKRWPDGTVGYIETAKVFSAMKRPDQAEKALREGLAKTNTSTMASVLYVFLNGQGRIEEADKELAKWVSAHPTDVDAMLLGFNARLAKRQYREAAGWIRKASEAKPESAQLMNNLATTLGLAGDPSALPIAKRALERLPKSVAIRDTVGTLQVQFGETEAGIENLRAVIAKLPKASSPRVTLARALGKVGRADEAVKMLDEAEGLAKTDTERKEIAELRKVVRGS